LKTLQENVLIDYEAEKGIQLLQLQNNLEEIASINYVGIKNN
jgi:hypothetical protein